MIINPKEAFVMGGTYRIPVLAGLFDSNLIETMKRDETFNEVTFGREYEILYSIKFINCWNILRALLLKRKHERWLNVNA